MSTDTADNPSVAAHFVDTGSNPPTTTPDHPSAPVLSNPSTSAALPIPVVSVGATSDQPTKRPTEPAKLILKLLHIPRVKLCLRQYFHQTHKPAYVNNPCAENLKPLFASTQEAYEAFMTEIDRPIGSWRAFSREGLDNYMVRRIIDEVEIFAALESNWDDLIESEGAHYWMTSDCIEGAAVGLLKFFKEDTEPDKFEDSIFVELLGLKDEDDVVARELALDSAERWLSQT